MITELIVLYDAECTFCRGCAAWLSREPSYIPLRVIPRRSPEALALLGGSGDGDDDLVAVTRDGDVYRGDAAFIICLYALRRYRSLSLTLGLPSLRPLARKAFALLSRNRSILGLFTGQELRSPDSCAEDFCQIRHEPKN